MITDKEFFTQALKGEFEYNRNAESKSEITRMLVKHGYLKINTIDRDTNNVVIFLHVEVLIEFNAVEVKSRVKEEFKLGFKTQIPLESKVALWCNHD